MYLFFDELAIGQRWSALFCATGVWGGKPIRRARVNFVYSEKNFKWFYENALLHVPNRDLSVKLLFLWILMPICQYHARGPSRALEFSSRWITFLGFLQKIWLWWKNIALFYKQKKKVLRFYVVSFCWPWYILKWRIDVISGSPESFRSS